MAVKIRLQRHGRGKRPFYHIVAADSRAPRDGKYIERIGDYNPLTKPATINVDADRAVDWLQKGAEVTDTIKALFKYKGILYKKHLSRGVAKGAFTTEEAEKRYQQWLDEHNNKVLDHQKKHHKDKTEIKAKLLEQEQKKAADRDTKRQAALAAAQEATKAAAAETTETAAPATENTAENTTENTATEQPPTEG
jgi:small subunit ribosomal protein S16